LPLINSAESSAELLALAIFNDLNKIIKEIRQLFPTICEEKKAKDSST
jgi:hypothetical protein